MCLPLTLLVLLAGPGLLLLGALAGLARHGPLGVLADVVLVTALVWTTRAGARSARAWWSRLGPPPTCGPAEEGVPRR